MASEKFKGEVVANSAGYYKGVVIKEGQKFVLECTLVEGKFPQWVKKPEGFKAKEKSKVKLKDLDVPEEDDSIV